MTLATTEETSPVTATDIALVILCSDVVKGRSGRNILERLSRSVPDAVVSVVRELCVAPSQLTEMVQRARADRVVVACREGTEMRGELVALLRRTGVHPSGVRVLDLAPGESVSPEDVAADSVVRIEAALARVRCGDITAPIRERGLAIATRFSRRNLFRPGGIVRSAIADWREESCDSGAACRACVDSCPVGALRAVGHWLEVDEVLCTGCGACVRSCRSGAMSLSGVPLCAFEADADVLVKGSPGLRSRPGVAVVCAHADRRMPLGDDWLPLEVPSLEIVSVGWLLQILAAGAPVRLVACDNEPCVTRGHEITMLALALAQEAAPGWNCQVVRDVGRDPARSAISVTCGREPIQVADATIRFGEPEATMAALSTRGSVGVAGAGGGLSRGPFEETPVSTGGEPRCIESAWLPLGDVTVDGSRCTACGRCALACPTSALAQSNETDAPFLLTLDAGACSACGACVSSCPQGAVNLRHVFESSRLTARRRTVFELASRHTCASCACPLAGGLEPSAIAERLAASHPQLAERLRSEVRCTDCLLAL